MRNSRLAIFFIANLILHGASTSWAKDAAYCQTTQVVEIVEHALTKSRNEQFRLVVSEVKLLILVSIVSVGERTHLK